LIVDTDHILRSNFLGLHLTIFIYFKSDACASLIATCISAYVDH
jgi:hypothetical protein